MRRLSFQAVATLLILLVCGGLVLYPVVFLVEAALNTSDPQEFPLLMKPPYYMTPLVGALA